MQYPNHIIKKKKKKRRHKQCQSSLRITMVIKCRWRFIENKSKVKANSIDEVITIRIGIWTAMNLVACECNWQEICCFVLLVIVEVIIYLFIMWGWCIIACRWLSKPRVQPKLHQLHEQFQKLRCTYI